MIDATELSLIALFLSFLFFVWSYRKYRKRQRNTARTTHTLAEQHEDTLKEDSKEDSEGDGLMSEGDLFFPEEEDED
jgi:cbb3-type cytochrome oxidase subunit 3